MIFSKEYTQIMYSPKIDRPYLTVQVCHKGWLPLNALVDTGFDGDLLVSKEIFDMYGGLDAQKKISNNPGKLGAANGTYFKVDIYKVTLNIETEQIETQIKVPIEDTRLLHDAFIGRKIMNDYKVIFDGKSSPRKIQFD